MKRAAKLFTAIIFACTPIIVSAQQIGDNAFIISSTISFDAIAKILRDSGYLINTRDTHFIRTNHRRLSSLPMSMKFLVMKKDSGICITAMTKPRIKKENIEEEFSIVSFQENETTNPWGEALKIARLIDPAVKFEKQ